MPLRQTLLFDPQILRRSRNTYTPQNGLPATPFVRVKMDRTPCRFRSQLRARSAVALCQLGTINMDV